MTLPFLRPGVDGFKQEQARPNSAAGTVEISFSLSVRSCYILLTVQIFFHLFGFFKFQQEIKFLSDDDDDVTSTESKWQKNCPKISMLKEYKMLFFDLKKKKRNCIEKWNNFLFGKNSPNLLNDLYIFIIF